MQSLNLDKAKAEARNADSPGLVPQQQPNPPREIDCLTVDEEQKLVGYYCIRTMEFADFCEFPTNVKVHIMRWSTRDGNMTTL